MRRRRIPQTPAHNLPVELVRFDPDQWADRAEHHCRDGHHKTAYRRWTQQRRTWARTEAHRLGIPENRATELLPDEPPTARGFRFCLGCI